MNKCVLQPMIIESMLSHDTCLEMSKKCLDDGSITEDYATKETIKGLEVSA
jgi:hypothetical protein